MFDYPPEWAVYPGHYRSHRGGGSNVRVILRKGRLFLIAAQGSEVELAPGDDETFGLGDDEPDRLYFDTVVNGEALHLWLSGGDYYRVCTA